MGENDNFNNERHGNGSRAQQESPNEPPTKPKPFEEPTINLESSIEQGSPNNGSVEEPETRNVVMEDSTKATFAGLESVVGNAVGGKEGSNETIGKSFPSQHQ